MIYVKRWFLDNALRNYNYMVINSFNNKSLIIDPTLSNHYIKFLMKNNIKLEAILLTHDHNDHTAASRLLRMRYKTPVYASFKYSKNTKIDYYLRGGEKVNFHTMHCQVIDSPGHTSSHSSFYFYSKVHHYLFSGDTIFNGGVGNLKDQSSNSDQLYNSVKKLKLLPGRTKLYPGHDYHINNLYFAQFVDSKGIHYESWLKGLLKSPDKKPIVSLKDENQMNIFFRVNEDRLQEILNKRNQKVNSQKSAFFELRNLKDLFRIRTSSCSVTSAVSS